MIDITVDPISEVVRIDSTEYIILEDIIVIIGDIIDKAKYSGETVTLWEIHGEKKWLVKEWN